MNNLCEELNPNNFIYFQYSYLDHLKNYYLENNNNNNGWMFVIQSLWKVWLYSRGTNERNKVGNYIGGQLISWSPNNCYYEEQYNFATKLHIVCRWKRKNGFPALAKKGEAICNDKLVNFFEEKEHKNCICSSV